MKTVFVTLLMIGMFGEFAKLNFPDAYSLQISVSGKAANCHRIAP